MPVRCRSGNAASAPDVQKAWNEVLDETAAAAAKGELSDFLDELLTVAERRDIALRWMVLKRLSSGETQRNIADVLGMSLCKITRGSKMLKQNGYLGGRFGGLLENGGAK